MLDYRSLVTSPRRLLYIFDESDWRSRAPVAARARDAGWQVTIGVVTTTRYRPMQLSGFEIFALPRPDDLTPLAALRVVHALRGLIRRVRPTVIHSVTLKYAFLVGVATAFDRRIARLYTLAGLGYLFRSDRLRARSLRALVDLPLAGVLRAPYTYLIFQNADDQGLLTAQGIARPERAFLVRGSGVDLKRFRAQPPPGESPPLVLMPTRLLHDKGVSVFVAAARLLRAQGVAARFAIAGGETQHNPDAISALEMNRLTADGAVDWLGRVEDLPSLLARAAVIAYPSHYGEGIPRVLLEALAVGRPIVTTDHPGCRETVRDEDNGLLVPVRDPEALARACSRLLADPALRERMGQRSRQRAEVEFDVELIARQTVDVYARIAPGSGSPGQPRGRATR